MGLMSPQDLQMRKSWCLPGRRRVKYAALSWSPSLLTMPLSVRRWRRRKTVALSHSSARLACSVSSARVIGELVSRRVWTRTWRALVRLSPLSLHFLRISSVFTLKFCILFYTDLFMVFRQGENVCFIFGSLVRLSLGEGRIRICFRRVLSVLVIHHLRRVWCCASHPWFGSLWLRVGVWVGCCHGSIVGLVVESSLGWGIP